MDEETYNKLKELDGRLREALSQHHKNMEAIATQHARNVEDLRSASARRQVGLSKEMNSKVERALLAAREDAEDVEEARHGEEMTRLSTDIWKALPHDWVDLREMAQLPTDT